MGESTVVAMPVTPHARRADPVRRKACRRVVVAVAVAIAAGLPVPVAGADLPATIRAIKPSIVGVGTFQELRRPPNNLLGTGFVVAEGRHVVTSDHVIPRQVHRSQGEYLCIFVGAGDRPRVVPVRIVARDPEHDVAILTFVGQALRPLSLGRTRDVEEGQEVAFTGFPIGTTLGFHPVTHRAIISAITPIAIPQPSPRRLDAGLIRRLRQRFVVLQLDAIAYPGNSGSPLYDRGTGAVVGVLGSVFVKGSKENLIEQPSGIAYAIPIRYAKNLLERLRIHQ